MSSASFYRSFVPVGDSLIGIINYLFPIYKSNYKNCVSISASSTGGIWDVNSLINPLRNSRSSYDNWASDNVTKSNVTVHFHKHLIDITNYSIRSHSNHSHHHPKSWQLDGSLDGVHWEYVDSQKDTTYFNSKMNETKTFPVKKTGTFLYFRFTQTDVNHSGDNFFDLGKLEFFGKIIKMSKLPGILRTKCYVRSRMYSYIFTIFVIRS